MFQPSCWLCDVTNNDSKEEVYTGNDFAWRQLMQCVMSTLPNQHCCWHQTQVWENLKQHKHVLHVWLESRVKLWPAVSSQTSGIATSKQWSLCSYLGPEDSILNTHTHTHSKLQNNYRHIQAYIHTEANVIISVYVLNNVCTTHMVVCFQQKLIYAVGTQLCTCTEASTHTHTYQYGRERHFLPLGWSADNTAGMT